MTDGEKLLDDDFNELTDIELTVLFIVSKDCPTSKMRLQDVSLIYGKIFERENVKTSHGAYFTGGFSDGVEESAMNLADIGIIKTTPKGYVLTEYGEKLQKYAIDHLEDPLIENVPKVVSSLSELPNINVTGLAYYLYEDMTVNSTIKYSVDKSTESAYYDGGRLTDRSPDYYENKIRNGEPIKEGI